MSVQRDQDPGLHQVERDEQHPHGGPQLEHGSFRLRALPGPVKDES
jgi:hypothetical protein